jgi:hypothetical protein
MMEGLHLMYADRFNKYHFVDKIETWWILLI